jgi:hypothetical protein
MIKNLLCCVLCMGGVSLMTAPAIASTITYTVNFAGSGFAPAPLPATPPIVFGQVHIDLDTAVDINNATSGITLDFLNVTLGSAISYSYNAGSDTLHIGGLQTSTQGLISASNDFWLIVSNLRSASPFVSLFELADNGPGISDATYAVVNVSQPPATTPVPAALPLLITALGGLGLVGWRRRKLAA